MKEGTVILLVGLVLAASIVVALGTARTGLPALVAFLAVGMLLGSEGPGGIEFDDAKLAGEVGIVGLALILYEGGLQTSWRRLRQVVVPAALLSTVGVAVSAVLTGVAAYSEPGSSISVSQKLVPTAQPVGKRTSSRRRRSSPAPRCRAGRRSGYRTTSTGLTVPVAGWRIRSFEPRPARTYR